MQDRPDAPELLGAVALYLFEDLLPHVPREHRFGVRVAANTCAIAAREAAAGDGPLREEAQRLTTLLGADPPVAPDRASLRAAQRSLAHRIRSGELDPRAREAVAMLRASVRAKLDVAHPGYDAVADDGRDP
jgi:hypothetical protein